MREASRNLNAQGAERLIEGVLTTVLDGSGLRVLRLFVLVDNPDRGCGGDRGGIRS
jgi:hypothetical protein